MQSNATPITCLLFSKCNLLAELRSACERARILYYKAPNASYANLYKWFYVFILYTYIFCVCVLCVVFVDGDAGCIDSKYNQFAHGQLQHTLAAWYIDFHNLVRLIFVEPAICSVNSLSICAEYQYVDCMQISKSCNFIYACIRRRKAACVCVSLSFATLRQPTK